MAPDPASDAPAPSPAWEARCLLRAARGGTIATRHQDQPFASLVTPACMQDGALLILVSQLSDHTRHLMADGRCSIMVSGDAVSPNPQTTPRISIIGQAEKTGDAALKARYLRVHPYAALYADFADFSTWRIVPEMGVLVGGFGRAHRLKGAELRPDSGTAAAIAEAEEAIIEHFNRVHGQALAGMAAVPGDWRMVSVDADGFDLGQGEWTLRRAWPTPVRQAADVRLELTRRLETLMRE